MRALRHITWNLALPVKLYFVLSGWLAFVLFALQSIAGTFPGNARLAVSDPTGGLSWNPTNNALTVQCWFKISIPSGTNLTQNMPILVNGTSGSESQYAYLVRFNIANGNVEFVAQGSSGGYTNTLIQLPYLERWYHLAIVQQGARHSPALWTGGRYSAVQEMLATPQTRVGSRWVAAGMANIFMAKCRKSQFIRTH